MTLKAFRTFASTYTPPLFRILISSFPSPGEPLFFPIRSLSLHKYLKDPPTLCVCSYIDSVCPSLGSILRPCCQNIMASWFMKSPRKSWEMAGFVLPCLAPKLGVKHDGSQGGNPYLMQDGTSAFHKQLNLNRSICIK